MIKELNIEYKDIEGYEGLYAVTVDGRVWSYKSKKFLKPYVESGDYLKVALCKDGNRKQYKVHRLVAEAFIPNPEGKPQVNHINEVKSDNRVENLEWATAAENNNHGTRNQRISKPVYCIEVDKVFPSITVAARELGISGSNASNIGRCCKGDRKSVNGYTFRFATIDDQAAQISKKLDYLIDDMELTRLAIEKEAALQKRIDMICSKMIAPGA